jgi:5-hydroxyisourate hydrolase-like protein (transthyretin family)
MVSVLPLFGSLLFAAFAGVQSPQAQTPPADTGRISGIVTRGDTGQPLPGVMLRVVRWDGGRGRQFPPVRTDADGRFVVEKLPAGEYALSFSADGFVSLELGQRRPQELPRRIRLTEGQHVADVEMTLPRTAAIEGHVLDEFGDPVPGIAVQVARVQYAAGKHRLMPMGSQGTPTDDLGRFRVFNLPPGEYYLVALSGPFAGAETVAGFALTYSPGTANPQDAQAVTVGVGQDVTGVTIPMSPAPMSTISGVTTDEQGTPMRSEIMLLPTSGGDVRAIIMSRTPTSPTGAFVFRNVAAGTYTLQAYGRPVGGGNLARAPFGATLVTVDGDVSNVNVMIATGATLRGRIIFEGDGSQLEPGRVSVFPAPVNFATGPVGGGPPDSVTSPDWTFETRNMNGSRVIRVNVPAGWILKQVTRDGVDITDRPVDFRKGDVTGVEVTITNRVATIKGIVNDGNLPAPSGSVLIFAEDPALWAFPSRYLAAVRSDDTGAFTATGLPGGDYLAIAVPQVTGTDWQDPAVLATYQGLATKVSVPAGTTATTSLRLLRR